MSDLELIWKTRRSGNSKTGQEYLEFVVGGEPLTNLVNAGDSIGCIGWLPMQFDQSFADSLLLKNPAELISGRYRLYICPECVDVDCGSITVEIEETASEFVWKNFGYEYGYESTIHYLEEWSRVGPFRFNKADYQHILTQRPSTKYSG